MAAPITDHTSLSFLRTISPTPVSERRLCNAQCLFMSRRSPADKRPLHLFRPIGSGRLGSRDPQLPVRLLSSSAKCPDQDRDSDDVSWLLTTATSTTTVFAASRSKEATMSAIFPQEVFDIIIDILGSRPKPRNDPADRLDYFFARNALRNLALAGSYGILERCRIYLLPTLKLRTPARTEEFESFHPKLLGGIEAFARPEAPVGLVRRLELEFRWDRYSNGGSFDFQAEAGKCLKAMASLLPDIFALSFPNLEYLAIRGPVDDTPLELREAAVETLSSKFFKRTPLKEVHLSNLNTDISLLYDLPSSLTRFEFIQADFIDYAPWTDEMPVLALNAPDMILWPKTSVCTAIAFEEASTFNHLRKLNFVISDRTSQMTLPLVLAKVPTTLEELYITYHRTGLGYDIEIVPDLPQLTKLGIKFPWSLLRERADENIAFPTPFTLCTQANLNHIALHNVTHLELDYEWRFTLRSYREYGKTQELIQEARSHLSDIDTMLGDPSSPFHRLRHVKLWLTARVDWESEDCWVKEEQERLDLECNRRITEEAKVVFRKTLGRMESFEVWSRGWLGSPIFNGAFVEED
ncbi:hypothetical protein CC2G_014216 [Coprinopsis cinerea AmutBmut pab1-1]|nr:hypothetical protein CC2G_014216 [Coprinopsis cinerea AmutBmut pab1-1]